MNELAHSISLLFEPDSAPVVGVSGGMILFFNPAALSLFPTLEQGQRASSVLPAVFLGCDENVFVCTAQVDQHSVSANGVWYNGLLLLRLNLSSTKYVFSPEALTAAMRLELASIHMALEELSRLPAGPDESGLRACTAVLYRSYYKLQRSCENIVLAEHLMRHSTVFRPVSVDPVSWLRNLTTLVTEAASNLGIHIRLDFQEALEPISADLELLEQMVLNLFSNSIRHCSPGGSITLQLRRQGSRLLLRMDDSGGGFPAELLGSLFQRQADNRTGSLSRGDQMGLFIVWGIAELHGGTVLVTNRRKGGASVQIELPAGRKGTLKLQAPSSDYTSGRMENKRILTALADVLPDEVFLPR